MTFRPKRRFIRTVIKCVDGRVIIRKSWSYGRTLRALRNACNKMLRAHIHEGAYSAQSSWEGETV